MARRNTDVGLSLLDGPTGELPLDDVTRELAVVIAEAPTDELPVVELADGATRQLGIPTRPTMPTIRPYPRVTYPPPVPCLPDALTALLPAMVRA